MGYHINIQGGPEGEKDLQKCDYSIQERTVNYKITLSPCPSDVDLLTQIGVCTERLVCTRYVPVVYRLCYSLRSET